MALLFLVGIAAVWLLSEHSLANLGRGHAGHRRSGPGCVVVHQATGGCFRSSLRSVHAVGWIIDLPIGNNATGTTCDRPRPSGAAVSHAVCPIARRCGASFRIALAFMVYLGALTASSILHSPDRADSLRMTFWIGLSMAGGLFCVLCFCLEATRKAVPAGCASQERGRRRWGFWSPFRSFILGPVIFAGPDSIPGYAGKIFGVSGRRTCFASLLAALSFFGHREIQIKATTAERQCSSCWSWSALLWPRREVRISD